MRRIFQQNDPEDTINRNGFVIIPFLEKSEIEKLTAIYTEKVEDLGADFFMSLWTKNIKRRREVDDAIRAVFLPKLSHILADYKCVIASFGVKKPTVSSAWFVHQDDSFIDENEARSVSVWVPLTDVTAQNGALQVIEASHLKFDGPRAPTLLDPYDDYREVLRQHFMTTQPMLAGEALFFDHRLIHASAPNLSDQIRLISVAVMAPRESDVIFYYRNETDPPGKVEMLKLTDNYYQEFPLGDKPTGPGVSHLRYINHVNTKWDQNTFNEKFPLSESPSSLKKNKKPIT